MTQWQIEYAIAELQRQTAADSATIISLNSKIAILEALLLQVPNNRLLGRYAGTTGPAQFVQIGTGLEIQVDTLVNTGGGGGGDPMTGASSDGFSSGFS